MTDDVHWTLWAGTVGFESALDVRFEAAASNGYSHVSLSALDVSREAGAGMSAADIRARAADAGLSLVIDPVMNWHPAAAVPRVSRFGRFSLDDNLRMSEQVGAVSLSAIAMATDDASLAQFVEPFAALCDRAAEFGARVHLEFIPMTPIADIVGAWQIVREADRANGGILVDSWHFFRGTSTLADLAAVPGDRIFTVQLDDALAVAGPDPWQDTQQRLLPGEGQLDLEGLLRVLAANDGLRFVGPEVISPAMGAMAPRDAARITRASIEPLLARALAGA
jgi:sugar phosphate isomerase/epimerase